MDQADFQARELSRQRAAFVEKSLAMTQTGRRLMPAEDRAAGVPKESAHLFRVCQQYRHAGVSVRFHRLHDAECRLFRSADRWEWEDVRNKSRRGIDGSSHFLRIRPPNGNSHIET